MRSPLGDVAVEGQVQNRRVVRVRGEIRRCSALLLVGLLVLSVAVFILGDESLGSGSDYQRFYRPVAESVVEGRGLYTEAGEVAARYPPGYPLALAPSFAAADALGVSHDRAAQFVSVVATAVSAVLLYLLLLRFLPRDVAFLGALLAVLNPLTVWYGKNPLSEPLFGLALLSCLLAFSGVFPDRATPLWPALVAGTLAGWAALIRPIGIGLLVPLMLVVFIRESGRGVRRPLAVSALLLVGVLMVVLPWEAWVYGETNDIVPLSTGGAVSVRDGLTFGVHPDEEVGTIWIPADLDQLMADASAEHEQLDSISGITGFLADQARENPAGVLELVSYKAARSWYGTEALNREPFILALQLATGLLAAYGMLLAHRTGRGGRDLLLLVIPVSLYFWLMTVAALSIVRYMLPIVWLLAGFVGLAVASLASGAYPSLGRRFELRADPVGSSTRG